MALADLNTRSVLSAAAPVAVATYMYGMQGMVEFATLKHIVARMVILTVLLLCGVYIAVPTGETTKLLRKIEDLEIEQVTAGLVSGDQTSVLHLVSLVFVGAVFVAVQYYYMQMASVVLFGIMTRYAVFCNRDASFTVWAVSTALYLALAVVSLLLDNATCTDGTRTSSTPPGLFDALPTASDGSSLYGTVRNFLASSQASQCQCTGEGSCVGTPNTAIKVRTWTMWMMLAACAVCYYRRKKKT